MNSMKNHRNSEFMFWVRGEAGQELMLSRCEENRVLLRVNSLKVSIQKVLFHFCACEMNVKKNMRASKTVHPRHGNAITEQPRKLWIYEWIYQWEDHTQNGSEMCAGAHFHSTTPQSMLRSRVTYQHFTWRTDHSFVLVRIVGKPLWIYTVFRCGQFYWGDEQERLASIYCNTMKIIGEQKNK